MKVFVSSTCHDLIDIRAELYELLRSLQISPVMSDESLSDFDAKHNENSIQSCLLNVESSDAIIVVHNQRYGPKLGQYGFEDLSATHLEYRRAKERNIPVHFFARDQLEAEYAINKKNEGNAELKWVSEKHRGLFELLREHREPSDGKAKESNWIHIFRNSFDLKQTVEKCLEPSIKPVTLTQAISSNRFPIFLPRQRMTLPKPGRDRRCQLTVELCNVANSPAFNFKMEWQSRSDGIGGFIPRKLVPPGECVTETIKVKDGFTGELEVQYDAAIGIHVNEKYTVSVWNDCSEPRCAVVMYNQEFVRAAKPIIALKEQARN